ncbi:MAG: hypothetical protein R3B07_00115 [Polyangiaceae bacterium]
MITLRKSILASALLLVTACANVLGIEDTEVAASCKPGDFAYDGGNGQGEGTHNAGPNEDFSCVGNLESELATSETVQITLNVGVLVTNKPLGGVTVKACPSRTDFGCATPQDEVTTGDDGVATLTVNTRTNRGLTGYQGYLQITGPDNGDDPWLDYLQYFSRPVVGDRTFPLSMLTRSDFKGVFLDTVGAEQRDDRGWLAVESVDCKDKGAPNIRLSVPNQCDYLDGASREFYFFGGGPSGDVSTTQPGEIALGGFLNIKPGNALEVRAYWHPEAQNLLTVVDRLIIRPNTLTTLRFEPNQ